MQKKWVLVLTSALCLFTILSFIITLPEKPQVFKDVTTTKSLLVANKNQIVKAAEPPVPTPSPVPQLYKMDWPKPDVVKGVYTTGWIAGSSKWFPRLIEFIDATPINALVVDIKDDTGNLSFLAEIPLAQSVNAAVKMIPEPEKMMQTLKEHAIYPIARIVVFKDPLLAKAKPEWAVKDIEGGLWTDRKGLHWVDPHNKEYWDYIVDIAKAAIRLGFQEIQFDYVRFTSDGNTKRCLYPFGNGQAAEDVIEEFLKYTRTQLDQYGVPISADIFGLTTSADADLGIGQRFEKIAQQVDIVCPMVYPSHYIPGNFGLKNPNSQPYQTVFCSVSDAIKRLEAAQNTTTKIRPWLQDFSLGVHYGRTEIQAQIKAVEDAGLKEWLFWNPSCRYNIEKYL
ncbi:MAG TPA: putative glycoside hydrolase [Bacillota bacterium]